MNAPVEPRKLRQAARISKDWRGADLDLYLGRCQVDTPDALVERTWREVLRRRSAVVDFGAGDGRFSRSGRFGTYLGYEIDLARSHASLVRGMAAVETRCFVPPEQNMVGHAVRATASLRRISPALARR